MRIHLGHHFYGAGNLGDDFMLAGFLAAMRMHAPHATFTCCVPFALDPLQRRFPEIQWFAYSETARAACIAGCDVWLGLGGSPFQSAQSRWFVDHLVGESARCLAGKKPMYYLGVGVQEAAELVVPDVQRLCAQAAGIWTRDSASAERIAALPSAPPVASGADLAYVFFRDRPPPSPVAGRLTLVANFDYAGWPGQAAFVRAAQAWPATERIWLAQESRELPGAERALYAALPDTDRAHWHLAVPDEPGSPLAQALARWPSGEWLVTSRYHATLAGAEIGSKIVIVATNEKLRAAAHDLGCPVLLPDAGENAAAQALAAATRAVPPVAAADRAMAACRDFARSAVALVG